MAIYRTIQISFWSDIKIMDTFTPEDKYFYLYLFTNPHTNLAGCYEFNKRQASLELGYSVDAIERLIERFEKIHRVVVYDPDTHEILIVNWSKFNWTSSDKYRKPLEKEIENVKSVDFKRFLTAIFNYEDTVPIPYRYPIDTTNLFCSNNNTNINNIFINNKKPKDTNNSNTTKDIYTEHFEEAYSIYPRKEGKKRAYECYKARLKEGYSEEELLTATKNYAAECEKEKREKKYIKMASTFFGVNTPFVDFLKGGEEETDGTDSETHEFTDEELKAYEQFKIKGFM